MNAALATGIAVTFVGLVGYAVGVAVEYPGRAFSLTLLMLGVALVAIGRTGDGETA